eukprot:TRINITY_DN139_c0_g1_i3.p1 TRINITY_DN139_c0_g1~~TRINITY_DN139_c0_g1_i3.p1  ORF type:complete len:909 (-),score=260.43 TRINITY_DN139_c0_g1_i3:165-2819(-)
MATEEPPTKKAKTEEAEAEAPKDESEPAKDEPAKEPEPPFEEQDAPAAKGVKVKDAAKFYTEDTTMNVMVSGLNTLMPLTDGGLQYLLAGCRSSIGLKSGRYMFEVKVLECMQPVEDPASKARVPQPRTQVKVGVATAEASLFLGDSVESVCFDSEGVLTYDKKSKGVVGEKFSTGDVVTVVLNLDSESPNANTISLFKNGKRASKPQALPEALHGKPLFPAITFKNATLFHNFGPDPMVALPFKCNMVNEVLKKDVLVKDPPAEPKDGKYDVLFPVVMPDEGGFDWLDQFLRENPQYTEISSRALLNWCEKSGINRPKGYTPLARSSNDAPDMGMGIAALDDLSVRRVLDSVAPIQKRHYVVMEVRGNLLKEERATSLERWKDFRRVATVLIGEPPKDFQVASREKILKQKQETSNMNFKTKQHAAKQKWLLQKKQKQLEKEKAAAAKKKTFEAKLAEHEKAKKEAAEKGEPEPDAPVQEPEEEKEEEEEPDPMDEEPPTVELTEEEQKAFFYKSQVLDMSTSTLNTSFLKFSLPEKGDGFDEVKFSWSQKGEAETYLKDWVKDKKIHSRIEEIQPGDAFSKKWGAWQKVVAGMKTKLAAYVQAERKKVTDAEAKAAKKKAYEAAKKKAEEEGKQPPAEEIEEDDDDDVEMKVDLESIDVFSVEDIMDAGGGEPLFSKFGAEDWMLLGLRVELHLLSHAFVQDASDTDRSAVPIEHLGFYYQKYFKKNLSASAFGLKSMEELLALVKDTIIVYQGGPLKLIESMLPDEMETYNAFVMLTEECRRVRIRKIALGDQSAKLKCGQPGMPLATGALAGPAPTASAQQHAAAAALAKAAQAQKLPMWQGHQPVMPRLVPQMPGLTSGIRPLMPQIQRPFQTWAARGW